MGTAPEITDNIFELVHNSVRVCHPEDGIDVEFSVFSSAESSVKTNPKYSEDLGSLWVRITPSARAILTSITTELVGNREAIGAKTDIQKLAKVSSRKMTRKTKRHPLIITAEDLLELNSTEDAA